MWHRYTESWPYTTQASNMVVNRCVDVYGQIRFKQTYPGLLSSLSDKVQQIFHRLDGSSIEEMHKTRFEFFTQKLLPRLKELSASRKRACIFVPSYLDFVSVRNYFMKQELSFAHISEFVSSQFFGSWR